MGLLAIVLVAVVGVVGLFSVLRSPQRMGLRSIATAPSGDLGDVAADLAYDSLAVLKGYGRRPVPKGLPSLESLRFDPAKERTGITFVSGAFVARRPTPRSPPPAPRRGSEPRFWVLQRPSTLDASRTAP